MNNSEQSAEELGEEDFASFLGEVFLVLVDFVPMIAPALVVPVEVGPTQRKHNEHAQCLPQYWSTQNAERLMTLMTTKKAQARVAMS